MKVGVDERTSDHFAPADPLRTGEELIIKEARRRHRRRLLSIAVIFVVVVAGAVVGLTRHRSSPGSSVHSAGTPKTKPLPLSACRYGQIEVLSLQVGAGAGNVDQVLGFVNTSLQACTIAGYPQVAALNTNGTEAAVAQPEQDGGLGDPLPAGAAPPKVTVTPGHTAVAMVSGSGRSADPNSVSCPVYYPKFRVTPPGEMQSKVVTAVLGNSTEGFPGCGVLRIGPVVSKAACGCVFPVEKLSEKTIKGIERHTIRPKVYGGPGSQGTTTTS
jgi:hypothetical protein